ncbi:hypothetical protein MHU86_25012 [Fragilaria crotonensis]|nr:hypothetical protein MHU86_25012 [Fragilaria crotonensis]
MILRVHEKALIGLTIGTLTQQAFSFINSPPPRVSFLPGTHAPQVWRTGLGMNLNSNDPFEILDLKATPGLDKQQIKRAYKRLALKYHPDVVTNSSSTPEEKQKAGEIFAKINWAYATLSGKNGESKATATSSSSATGTGSSNTGGYQPPHRRTSSYTNPFASTDWRDYMPKYDEEDAKYDAGGDSFGKIFSDLLTGVQGAAAGAAVGGGGGVFRDFLEFLERNVDGYSGGDDDSELLLLLSVGTLEDVANEMDDTDLVVQQLSSKMKSIDDELIMVQADLKVATKFSEKLDFSERIAELEARKKVVKGFLDKARKRLISIQTRYKTLVVGGLNDRRAGGRSRSSSYSAQAPDMSGSSSSDTSAGPTTSNSAASTNSDSEDSWKTQGFSSSGRRGSNRRRRDVSFAVDDPIPPPPRQEPVYQAPSRSATSSSPNPPPRDVVSNQSSQGSTDWSVPPHRRTSSYQSDDKRRIREIKVDEEFDKLKKDLGLS